MVPWTRDLATASLNLYNLLIPSTFFFNVPFAAFHCNSVEGKHHVTATHTTHTFVVCFYKGWTLELNVFLLLWTVLFYGMRW
jgi:hypothetical protein